VFGDNYKICREFLGINQGEIEKATGIKQSALSRYERNESTPGVEVAQKLCEALGVSIDLIMTKTVIDGRAIQLDRDMQFFKEMITKKGLTPKRLMRIKEFFEIANEGI
jgi:transcriptional regulator with XRE-family HTH domain